MALSVSALKNLSAALTGAVALTGGGAIICSAHDALPGDALYSVKTAIGEPSAVSLNLSPEAKVEVLGDQAQARIGEGAELAVRGDLTPARTNELVNRFRVLSNDAQRRTVDVAQSDLPAAARLACDLQANLSGDADLLASLGAQADAANANAAAGLEAAVRAEANDALALCGALREKAGANLRADAQASLQAATDAVARARTRLGQTEGALGGQLSADAEAQLDAAQRIIAGGQGRLDAGAFAEAAEFFRLADRLAGDVTSRNDALLNIHAQGGADADAVIRAVGNTGNSNVNIDGLLNLEGSGNAGTGGVNVGGTVNGAAGGTGTVAPIGGTVGGSVGGSGTGGVTVDTGSAAGTVETGTEGAGDLDVDLDSGVIFPSL